MIFEFIQTHKILEIGLPKSVDSFAELILDNPNEFVNVVSQSGYYISTIIWYEHTKIHAESNFGFGGPKDPRFPQEYFFSETGLSKSFDELTDKDEYCSYMKEVQSQHPGVPLIPSFQIYRKYL